MHILFAGGGTAGHINPALAIAGYIREKHPDAHISYIGTPDKLEAKLVPEKGYNFRTIEVSGLTRSFSPKGIIKNAKAISLAANATVNARKILKELEPDVVVGTGGYVSGPVIRAAAKLGIKTAIHEQNAFPGVTTKMLASKVDAVMLAMPEAQKYMTFKNKPYITGNPVRRELLSMTREKARTALGLDDRPLLLSFGGSLGAKYINLAVEGLIEKYNNSGRLYHIHGTGKSGYQDMLNHFKEKNISLCSDIEVREYIKNMDECMAAADLVISRAGAITLSEITALGKPAVLIPSPYVAENHQYHNAMTLKRAGAAEIIEEKDLSSDKLISVVDRLIENKPRLERMSQNAKKISITDANERIYEVIMRLYTNA